MTYLLAILMAALAAVLFLIGAWWGAVFAIVIGVVAVAYIALARRQDSSVGTIETGRREPTGTPRKSRSDAETANERVGQT